MRKLIIPVIVWLGLQGCLKIEETQNFYELTEKVMERCEEGKFEEVKKIVKELNEIIPNFKHDWNYGNAIHKVNIVQGRIALKEGKISEAKEFLLGAGKTVVSPQLNTFGPNMTLAKELLLEGEKTIVIEYLELCKNFWEMDRGKIEVWKRTIREGRIPNFGANLEY